MSSLFSVTIYFVIFRESLETALILSVLLSLVDQILHEDPSVPQPDNSNTSSVTQAPSPAHTAPLDSESNLSPIPPHVLRKLRLQVVFGALRRLGYRYRHRRSLHRHLVHSGKESLVRLGAVVGRHVSFHTSCRNNPDTFSGIFELIASLMIFVMGVTMLKMENARTKWRITLQNAFNSQRHGRGANTSKWVLFLLPMITVLREGLEAVVFVSGVALAQPATSIPIAVIVGIISGIACGLFVYRFASRATFKLFLVCMTNIILLIGAGLFSRAIWAFQENAFLQLIGAATDDAGGTGPGSYDVRNNVWHLDCCSSASGSWSLFNAVLGWQNSATLGSVLSYIFYWLAVIVVLVYYKFREGRTKIFGWESANGKRRRQRREAQESGRESSESPTQKGLQVEMAVAGQAPPKS
ncbi:iron permease FTR1 [Butyriboletus roseoflavus]|nr:iron permease FTR1 [Butyriboletus roseoflavus]